MCDVVNTIKLFVQFSWKSVWEFFTKICLAFGLPWQSVLYLRNTQISTRNFPHFLTDVCGSAYRRSPRHVLRSYECLYNLRVTNCALWCQCLASKQWRSLTSDLCTNCSRNINTNQTCPWTINPSSILGTSKVFYSSLNRPDLLWGPVGVQKGSAAVCTWIWLLTSICCRD
jgi:hypothetical protein